MITPLLLAVQFLTILPIRISRNVNSRELPASMRYYPLVGAALGVSSAAVFWAALRLFSPIVAVVSAEISLAVFSRALHLDGFADMCDGFYGQRDREHVLAIMKDSRSGAMAIVGVFCLLSLKMALLAGLDGSYAVKALILAPVIGRWSMVWLCATNTYARSEGGTASAYIGHVTRATFLIASILCAGIACLLFRVKGLLVLAAAIVGIWMFRRYTVRRIGGMTGDTLGACSECVEVLVLAALGVHWPVFWL